MAGEDISSFKSTMGSDIKERGWSEGGVAVVSSEGDSGGRYGEDGIHI